jgi:glycosyltransferase involved in cell wall biosynthesis
MLRSGAIVLAYNQEEYLGHCLRALLPCVDHVVALLPDAPFVRYNPDARREFDRIDATPGILAELAAEHDSLVVVEGRWDDEPAMRNEGLAHLRARGVEVCLSVDADEFWPDGGVARLLAAVEADGAPGTVYFARYHTCYRSFERRVVSDHRMAVAVHLVEDTHFPRRRTASGPRRDLPDEHCFWNMGYVLSDERMWEKIRTWSHAHEVIDGWWRDKWLGFTPATRDLFRKEPASRWPCTVPVDPAELPSVLHDHPFFPHEPAAQRSAAR